MNRLVWVRLALVGGLALLVPGLGQGQGFLNKLKSAAGQAATSQPAQAAAAAAAPATQPPADDRGVNDILLAVSLPDNPGAFEAKEGGASVVNTMKRAAVWAMRANQDNAAQAAAETQPWEVLRLQVSMAERFYKGRRLRTASYLFQEGIDIAVKNEYWREYAFPRAVAGLGLSHLGLGRYASADSLLRRAVVLQDSLQGDTSLAAAAARSNLAVLHRELGRYSEAEALSAQLVERTRSWGKREVQTQAIIRNNHAMLLSALGRDAEAEQLLRQALKVLDEKDLLGIQLLSNLALVAMQQGNFPRADSLYAVAIARQKRRVSIGNNPDLARLYNSQAALHLAMGKTDDVAQLLQDALKIYKGRFGEKHPAYGSTLHNLGSFHLVQGQFAQAEPALTQAEAIRREVLGPNHPDLAATQDALAVLYWHTNRADKATALFRQLNEVRLAQVQRFFPAMSEVEKARFWSRIHPGLERFTNYAIANGKQDPSLLTDLYTLQLTTKALLLDQSSQLRKRIEASGNAALQGRYRAWSDAAVQLAQAYSRSKEDLAEEGTNLDSLERAVNQLEREVGAAAAQYGGLQRKPVTLAEVRAALKPGQVAVEVLRVRQFARQFTGEHTYAALVLAPGSEAVTLAVAPAGAKLESGLLTRYRRSIRNQQPVDSVVYAGYWGWLEPAVGTAKDVYVSLDGVYHQISLGTLQNGAAAPFLLQQRVLHTLVSTRDLPALAAAGKSAAPAKAVLIGDPDFAAKLDVTGQRGGISPLPGTAVEITKLKALLAPKGFQTTVFLKGQATEKALKQARKPRVLHVATHGYFLSDVNAEAEQLVFGVQPDKALVNPMLRSGLLLTGADWTVQNLKRPEGETGDDDNGILTAFEALNLDLQGTDLVVLSACETGLGDVQAGEGVYGLQRAFQLAGAKALVISLWRVDDEATQQLMGKFYGYWLAGRPLKEAFQQAQLDLRAKFPQPYYWGAFQLIGA